MKLIITQAVKYKGVTHPPDTTVDFDKKLAQQLEKAGIAHKPVATAHNHIGDASAKLIQAIRQAKTLDELEQLVDDSETRDAVKDAASQRWQELEQQ